ncbi:hypothetical protein NDU88_007257 [Pleurodeles waltl]|uniref:Uncharacterized protein n=1 Tax=Pleurodeles waltl TaxID=8319 RepID=A0AAV7MGF2_PLEWA|nr:hypothetical protein NDU88_007257 [Pleurodeles waltl]
MVWSAAAVGTGYVEGTWSGAQQLWEQGTQTVHGLERSCCGHRVHRVHDLECSSCGHRVRRGYMVWSAAAVGTGYMVWSAAAVGTGYIEYMVWSAAAVGTGYIDYMVWSSAPVGTGYVEDTWSGAQQLWAQGRRIGLVLINSRTCDLGQITPSPCVSVSLHAKNVLKLLKSVWTPGLSARSAMRRQEKRSAAKAWAGVGTSPSGEKLFLGTQNRAERGLPLPRQQMEAAGDTV